MACCFQTLAHLYFVGNMGDRRKKANRRAKKASHHTFFEYQKKRREEMQALKDWWDKVAGKFKDKWIITLKP